jgi:hypothetical protein
MRRYLLSPSVYLERFDAEALLLVADWNRLLTINPGAADLFELSSAEFRARDFTSADLTAWLCRHYDLPVAECRSKSRELLAFALKHHIVERAAPKPPAATIEEPT